MRSWTIVAAALALVACGTQEPEDLASAIESQPAATPSVDGQGHGAHGATVAANEPTGLSLYNLSSTWVDQHGRSRPLGSLGGRVQVVAMVYTHCGYACPRIIMDMKRIEGLLPDDAEVGFVLVSIDPERDTPGRLGRYAESVALEPDRWTLLTAPDPDILELAAVLGVRYRRTADGEFEHSNVITVLDPAGETAHRQLGLGQDPTATVAAIRPLLP